MMCGVITWKAICHPARSITWRHSMPRREGIRREYFIIFCPSRYKHVLFKLRSVQYYRSWHFIMTVWRKKNVLRFKSRGTCSTSGRLGDKLLQILYIFYIKKTNYWIVKACMVNHSNQRAVFMAIKGNG